MHFQFTYNEVAIGWLAFIGDSLDFDFLEGFGFFFLPHTDMNEPIFMWKREKNDSNEPCLFPNFLLFMIGLHSPFSLST